MMGRETQRPPPLCTNDPTPGPPFFPCCKTHKNMPDNAGRDGGFGRTKTAPRCFLTRALLSVFPVLFRPPHQVPTPTLSLFARSRHARAPCVPGPAVPLKRALRAGKACCVGTRPACKGRPLHTQQHKKHPRPIKRKGTQPR